MHRISAILHKRPKEGKHCDQEDDTGSIFSEDPSDGSSRSSMHSPPRLVRSPGIRGLRKIDDIDSSRFSLSNAADHVTEPSAISSPDGSTSPNFSYTYTTASLQTGSPLPSPPRSPVLSAGQTPSLWPLPSPRQLPKKHENSDRSLNGCLEHSDSGEGFVHQSELLKYSLSGVTKENPQKFSSNTVSPKVGAVNHGNSGQNSHSAYLKLGGAANSPRYMYGKQVEPAGSSGHALNSTSNFQELQRQKDTRLRTSEHAFLGGTTEEDSLGTEFRHGARYSHKDVPMSRDVGLSSHHSQESALSYPPSPPLSPSSFRSISPGGWIKGHLLGSGAFGKVYKGIHSETGEFCAIKEVEFVQDDHRSQESVEQLKREIALLSTLQHPNIVQYKGSELVGNNLYIYLELVSGGSLYKLYQEFKKLEEPVIRRYTRQILLGLHYLHSRKFVHRDIKCANLLVDQDGNVKLADFGVSKYIKEQGSPFSLRGSPHWMAPEVILSINTGYEYAVDIWSLGCTVIEMVTGKPPWSDLHAAAAMFKVTKVGAPPIPENLSADGRSFIRLCLQRNPADRPTAAVLLEHPFVKIQKESHHGVLYSNDSSSNMDYEEHLWAHLPSSISGTQPSLSAPSSPNSTRRSLYGFSSSQPDLIAHERDIARGIYNAHKESETMSRNTRGQHSASKQRHSCELAERTRPSEQRHSHQISKQYGPSLSAPVSPKSPRMHEDVSSLHWAYISPGYATPFSDSTGS